jgi:hypothetical protein
MTICLVVAALPLLLNFVVLHRTDGQEVAINPPQVTSLRAPAGPLDHLAPHGAHCVVGLTDGKFVAVIETCRTVQQMLEGTTR